MQHHQKQTQKKAISTPLKARKEIDEENRPDLIHAMSIHIHIQAGGGEAQTIRILEFRPRLARSWRLWSKNVPIYRKRKKRKERIRYGENVVTNSRFPFPCICGVPGISYYSRGLGRYP